MAIGLIGRKAGMTSCFHGRRRLDSRHLIEVEPNRVAQVKTEESDGYRALQVTVGSRRASRVTKPMAGHFAKAASRRVAVCGNFVWRRMRAPGSMWRRTQGGFVPGRSEGGCDRHHHRQRFRRFHQTPPFPQPARHSR